MGGELEGGDREAESEESGPESRRAHLNGKIPHAAMGEKRLLLLEELVMPDGLLRGGRSLRDVYNPFGWLLLIARGDFCADHRVAPGEDGISHEVTAPRVVGPSRRTQVAALVRSQIGSGCESGRTEVWWAG